MFLVFFLPTFICFQLCIRSCFIFHLNHFLFIRYTKQTNVTRIAAIVKTVF
ncbi:gp30 [Listeria phage B025]|uniref:Gp30 n=1 Tax=Listeria phage B025 TaxID=330396 RepID=A8ATC3_9CAUD|nr:gp30 [Listeria phage B025]AAY53069.1 gp30 [Listeria phage B025]